MIVILQVSLSTIRKMNDRDINSACVPVPDPIELEGFLPLEQSSRPDLFATFSGTFQALTGTSLKWCLLRFWNNALFWHSYHLPVESLGSSPTFPWQRRPCWSHSQWPKKGSLWKTPYWRLFLLFPLVHVTFLHQVVCIPRGYKCSFTGNSLPNEPGLCGNVTMVAENKSKFFNISFWTEWNRRKPLHWYIKGNKSFIDFQFTWKFRCNTGVCCIAGMLDGYLMMSFSLLCYTSCHLENKNEKNILRFLC